MDALSQALPWALSAAFYPPALLVLLLLLNGERPRVLVVSYYAGAAISTVSCGLIALAVLTTGDLTTQDSRTASGSVYVALGLLLLVFAPWAWRRRAHPPEQRRKRQSVARARMVEWSNRARTRPTWAFVLGIVMFLPSPLYILAVKEIADSAASSPSSVLAVVICALAVMLFVEVPLVALFLRPASATSGIQRFDGWLKRNGWSLAAALALLGGVYAIVEGVNALS